MPSVYPVLCWWETTTLLCCPVIAGLFFAPNIEINNILMINDRLEIVACNIHQGKV